MSVISLGAWGGPGGSRWSCIATNGITEIAITTRKEANIIKSFSFTDASGVFSGTFGGRNPDPGDCGEEKKIPVNWPSEYLMSVSGTYGDYEGEQVILSLSFITNLAKRGPFGSTNNTDQAFSIRLADSSVVGFYGRAGSYLNSIGIHVEPIFARGSVSVGPWGDFGQSNFTFNVDPGYIQRIVVSYGENIKSISFQDSDGRKYGPFGGTNPKDTDVQEEVIEIGNSQRLTSISGTYGIFDGLTEITSLSFQINNTINGPYGTQTGTSFSIPIQGSEVTGFFGKSGWYLDSIGVYVKQRMNARATTLLVGPWGDSGRSTFSFDIDHGYIKRIMVSYGKENIKSISFQDSNGREYGPFGGQNPEGTDVQSVIEIGDSQRLTSISGTYGILDGLTEITSLSFQINNTINGPYGSSTGTSFSIPIQGSEVTGFFGKSGWYLDSIGVYVKQMNAKATLLVGPWGDSGRNTFSFDIDHGYVKRIMVSYGKENIKSISFQDSNGREYGPFGGQNPEDTDVQNVIEIENSQRLTSISGTYGLFDGLTEITSLSFQINNTINGPYGTPTGTSFSIPIQGSEVTGFFGKSGWYLDSIGIYIKQQDTI